MLCYCNLGGSNINASADMGAVKVKIVSGHVKLGFSENVAQGRSHFKLSHLDIRKLSYFKTT